MRSERAKILTAEDAEDAEAKTEGKRERIEDGGSIASLVFSAFFSASSAMRNEVHPDPARAEYKGTVTGLSHYGVLRPGRLRSAQVISDVRSRRIARSDIRIRTRIRTRKR
jgi:hypothetical protein